MKHVFIPGGGARYYTSLPIPMPHAYTYTYLHCIYIYIHTHIMYNACAKLLSKACFRGSKVGRLRRALSRAFAEQEASHICFRAKLTSSTFACVLSTKQHIRCSCEVLVAVQLLCLPLLASTFAKLLNEQFNACDREPPPDSVDIIKQRVQSTSGGYAHA